MDLGGAQAALLEQGLRDRFDRWPNCPQLHPAPCDGCVTAPPPRQRVERLQGVEHPHDVVAIIFHSREPGGGDGSGASRLPLRGEVLGDLPD